MSIDCINQQKQQQNETIMRIMRYMCRTTLASTPKTNQNKCHLKCTKETNHNHISFVVSVIVIVCERASERRVKVYELWSMGINCYIKWGDKLDAFAFFGVQFHCIVFHYTRTHRNGSSAPQFYQHSTFIPFGSDTGPDTRESSFYFPILQAAKKKIIYFHFLFFSFFFFFCRIRVHHQLIYSLELWWLWRQQRWQVGNPISRTLPTNADASGEQNMNKNWKCCTLHRRTHNFSATISMCVLVCFASRYETQRENIYI